MAGSTISGGRTGSKKSNGGTKHHSNHSNHPGNGQGNGNGHGNGSTYRVTIDVRKIQANVYANEGGRLSELAVRNWLRSVGFHPESGGKTWLGDVESLSRLDKSEIVRSERVHRANTRL
jgi:hypothetical protein